MSGMKCYMTNEKTQGVYTHYTSRAWNPPDTSIERQRKHAVLLRECASCEVSTMVEFANIARSMHSVAL